MCNIIETLQESDNCYYLDYIPYNTDDSTFLELEDYFIKTYLQSFSQKVSRIVLKLIYFYPSEIYLTELTKTLPDNFDIPIDVNIRSFTPDKLDNIIQQIILHDFSSVQILFIEPSFLMSIDGEFSVTVYNPTDEVIQLLTQLTQQEGLFFKKCKK